MGPKAAEARTRTPLTRERVLQAASDLADRDGLEALTMRALADALGVEAMSIYYHLPNKDAILDGVVELTFTEVGTEAHGRGTGRSQADAAGWAPAVRERILGARRVLLRHPWAPVVIDQRKSFSPAMVRHVDGIVGIMREAGMSHDLIHHSLHAIGNRIYGYVQELSDDGQAPPPGQLDEMQSFAPNLAAMLADVAHVDPESTLGWCDDQTEFEFGLDLLLEGIERRRLAEAAA
ncbi:TetR family transcriptional regulator [Agromyces luteolus]|uniref:TetR family transcriptional regulator n=1 Tax=Agromyces luteolus TaxID=88373 RepID=A0A7C9HS32_9MICO|nr:TetR/AcrR family transcriptional regulator [Agromyces luteolus]MUN08069.1 TetR family transcriptional regulator [Agromyces luteolus]GLK27915.1 TetR family transcriptional regulator [Agromyces luteolus]